MILSVVPFPVRLLLDVLHLGGGSVQRQTVVCAVQFWRQTARCTPCEPGWCIAIRNNNKQTRVLSLPSASLRRVEAPWRRRTSMSHTSSSSTNLGALRFCLNRLFGFERRTRAPSVLWRAQARNPEQYTWSILVRRTHRPRRGPSYGPGSAAEPRGWRPLVRTCVCGSVGTP